MTRAGIRISGGALRGRRVAVLPGTKTRPMRSRVREALFSILGDLTGARVLDLFSGSGAIAIEALSRGAREAVLVENDPAVVALLRSNLTTLGLTARTRLEVIDAYATMPTRDGTFLFVFLDPPFRYFSREDRNPFDLATRLATSHLLAPGGWIGLECPSRHEPQDPPATLTVEVARQYGDTTLILWRRLGDTESSEEKDICRE